MRALYILDAYALIYRCYFAFGTTPLVDSAGRNTASIFGVFNTLHSFFHKYHPQSFAAAFDSRTPTFRHEMYGDYKANRAAAPEDLHAQVPWIEEAFAALGVPCVCADGFEADDIIATLSKKCKEEGRRVYILTGDKDLCALVNDECRILKPLKKGEWQEIGEKEVLDEWGVKPAQIGDLLALMGDSSDNIPGIKGVGQKTAAKYLCQWGTLENVLEHSNEVKGAAGEKLRAGRESALLSKRLVSLRYDVPLMPLQTDNKWQYEECAKTLLKYELKSLAVKWRALDKGTEDGGRQAGGGDKASLMKTHSSIRPEGLPTGQGQMTLLYDSITSEGLQGTNRLPTTDGALAVMAWLLESDKTGKDAYSLHSLAAEEGLDENESATVLKLQDIYEKRLIETGMMGLYTQLEMPLMNVLRKMEKRGIHIETKVLQEYGDELSKRIAEIETKVYLAAGHTFNIASPKQLSAVLYDEMALDGGKKRSTDAATLEALLDENAIVGEVLQWRELSKLRSTYVETLPRLSDENGRVHTTFVQTGTATGRLSSRDPNLQNIPVRTDEGRRIRNAFTAPEGKILVSADYSQIELAVLAHLTGDSNMCEAFKAGVDIHKKTAMMIFGTEDVTAEMRRAAKTINFGVIYGMSAFRLSRELGISRTEASQFIDKYFAAYPAIEVFKARSIQMAREEGYVTTLMGRRRYIKGLFGNRMEKEAAERVCINTRVQGTAADIMKKAMLDVDGALQERGLKSAMLLQVHDELIFECEIGEEAALSNLVKDKMETAVHLNVPLRVSVESGKCWGDFH